MWEVQKWMRAVRQFGPYEALRRFWVLSDVKAGQLVGVDKLGNRYYQNKDEVVWGRDRWVEYAHNSYPRDASHVPPEWHAWLHRLSDVTPSGKDAQRYFPSVPPHVWAVHAENYTGTDAAFRTYNTTRPKIQPWSPTANTTTNTRHQ